MAPEISFESPASDPYRNGLLSEKREPEVEQAPNVLMRTGTYTTRVPLAHERIPMTSRARLLEITTTHCRSGLLSGLSGCCPQDSGPLLTVRSEAKGGKDVIEPW